LGGGCLRFSFLRRPRRPDAHPLSASEIERIDKAAHVAFRRDQTA
jgi:hypothetical protein